MEENNNPHLHQCKLIHTYDEKKALARTGEGLQWYCSGPNDMLSCTLEILNSIVPVLEELVYKKTRFRAEMYFDPEADKFEFLTFTEDGNNDTSQEG